MKPTTRDAGYTLVELLISTTIMLVVTGAIFTIVNPARDTSRVQPEMSDQQQRLRVGAEMLYKDLVMAGAGVYQGASSGTLNKYFAPIQPYRTGRVDPDPAKGVFYRPDAISMVYVPNTAAQTTIRAQMPQPSSEIKVNAQPNCPVGDNLCGFKENMSLLIFDETGTWDSFEVTNVQDDALHLQHRGQVFNKAYDAGANIVQADWHTYYLNQATNQLMHYDGLFTETPIVDNVVGLQFTYFGIPDPPLEPKPVIGVENCVIGADGKPKLATLSAASESLVELDPSILTDGGVGAVNWCGANANIFDPDLYRIRKVRVTLRMQVGLAALRGTDTRFFRHPGTAKIGERYVPDYEMVFDVTPRNLNLAR